MTEASEMKPVAWGARYKGAACLCFVSHTPLDAEGPYEIIPLFPSATIAALVAERNDLALRAAVLDEALTNAVQMRRHAETERDEARKERDHWKTYSSGQGKLISSGVFVHNDEYVRLNAAKAALAEAQAEVERLKAAIAKRADWHKCSCPEPCDDYGVFPGGCDGRYREDYLAIAHAAIKGGQDDRP